MEKYYYLIEIQYLGFRYHGWLKQPGVKTVESMVRKTLGYIMGPEPFKILGTSRTDSKVSANQSAFELFVDTPIDTDSFLLELNLNLPNDIRALKIKKVDKTFNIINTPRVKEYIYLFSFGEKPHPFSAPIISSFKDHLDIKLMKEGANLFIGPHDFKRYCTKPGPNTQFLREILVSQIEENTEFTASFFPKQSYAYRIQSKGFMRNQVRLMMGHLLSLGRGETTLTQIKKSLEGKDTRPLRYIAPASGLILNKIKFE
jgi:tRNA pseudouridine38-40 synthase